MTEYVPTEAEDVEAPISASFVTAAGFERAQLTVRANDAEQLVARLGELTLVEALDKVIEFNIALQKKAGAAAPSAPATQSGSPSRTDGQAPASQPSAAAAPSNDFDGSPHPEGITCSAPNCGQPVVGKSIKSKKPPYKTYEMWVCPNQRSRNDGHFSEFVN